METMIIILSTICLEEFYQSICPNIIIIICPQFFPYHIFLIWDGSRFNLIQPVFWRLGINMDPLRPGESVTGDPQVTVVSILRWS